MHKRTKNITLNVFAKLATTMEAGFKVLENKMDKGFQTVSKEMADGFKKAEENREDLAVIIAKGFDGITGKMASKDDVAKLERSQENIQLRIDNLAPQFEVKDLEYRVKRLEDRVGIGHTIQSQ